MRQGHFSPIQQMCTIYWSPHKKADMFKDKLSRLMSEYSVCIVWYMIEASYLYDHEIHLDFGQIVFGSLLWVETRELYVVSRLRAAPKASKAPQVYISHHSRTLGSLSRFLARESRCHQGRVD